MAIKFYSIAQEMVGTKVGRWSVLAVGEAIHSNLQMLCRCECGTERPVRITRLLEGRSNSCGCLLADNLTTHGRTKTSIRKFSHEYWIWNSMKQRCFNPKCKEYRYYGARGITVCERWLTFANFYADMGQKPEGKSIERKDNAGHYTKDNCVWADRKTQNSNKSNNHLIEVDGEIKTITEWSRVKGLPLSTILRRIKAGYSDIDAITAIKYRRQSAPRA